MKKIILILLFITAGAQAQTLQNPTYGNTTTNTLKIKTPATVTGVSFLGTVEADGIVSKIAPVNINIPYTPVNYSISNQSIGQHLTGIDTRLGQISSTSAGITQRVYFTADNTTVNSVVYFASSLTGKGSTATGSPTALVLGDNTKAFFTKDIISISQPTTTIGYAGTYSGNLTVSATPTPNATQQRFTIEIYRTNNLGVPIASGVSGAPTGDLGTTVIAVLDSGIINLVAGDITNIHVSGILTQNVTLNTGERLRYHVSAAKIGTGGGNVTFGVYYGSSYNSYYDVPVAVTTDAVVNKSSITGITSTDAFNNLDASVIHKTGNETKTGTLTATSFINPAYTIDNSLLADGSVKTISNYSNSYSQILQPVNVDLGNKNPEISTNIFTRRNLFNTSETYTAGNGFSYNNGATVDQNDFIYYKGVKLTRCRNSNYYSSISLSQAVMTVGKRYMISYYIKSNIGEDYVFDDIADSNISGHNRRYIDNSVRRIYFIGQAITTTTVDKMLVTSTPLGSGSGTNWILGSTKGSTGTHGDYYFGGVQIEEISNTYVDGIVWMGDSTIQGDAGTNNGYQNIAIPSLTSDLLNCSSFNKGVAGERLDQIDARWSTSVTPVAPNSKYVIIQGGINDILQNTRTLADMQASLNSMYTKALADNLIPIFLTCTPVNSFNGTQEALRNSLNTWLKTTFSRVIDINQVVEYSGKIVEGFPTIQYTGDGTHYGINLRKAVASFIAKSPLIEFIQPTDYQLTSSVYAGRDITLKTLTASGVTYSSAPTTSGGAYYFLTGNNTTNVTEKILSSSVQPTLVSNTNIKTVGGVTLLGSGNVTEVQNSLTASTTLAPSVTAVNTALGLKADLVSPAFTGTPTAPTPTTTTSIANKSYVDGLVRPYKSYVVTISQGGTSNPTVTVFENQLSGAIVWARGSTGSYTGTLTGAFTASKTYFDISNNAATGASPNYFIINRIDANTVNLQSSVGSVATDGILNNMSLEIRVYN